MKCALHIGAHEELIHEYFLTMSDKWIFDYVLHKDNPIHKYENDETFKGRTYIVTPYARSKVRNFIDTAKILYDKRNYYQIIHAHGGRSQILLLLWCRIISKAKIIAHAHTTGCDCDMWHRKLLNKFCEYLFWFLCHRLLACSENASAYLFGRRPVKILKNIINYVTFQTKRNGTVLRPTIIMMSDYIASKNHLFALDIIHDLVRDGEQEFSVQMFGEDKGTKELVRQKINKLGLDEIITVNERILYPEKAYTKADILLMPSIFEGFGLAAVEGQVSNLICLVSDDLPKSVKISEYIEFISLKRKDLWVSRLKNAIETTRALSCRNYLINSNYDSNIHGNGLLEIYED